MKNLLGQAQIQDFGQGGPAEFAPQGGAWAQVAQNRGFPLKLPEISEFRTASRRRPRILVRGGYPAEFWPQGGAWAQNLFKIGFSP